MRYPNRWTVGEWTFVQVEDHGFTAYGDQPLYGFTVGEPEGTAAGKLDVGELYPTLEHAMAAAIAEKHTGRRGAGGTGVGTAADWFMRMIGVDQLRPAGDTGTEALSVALVGNGATADRWTVRRIERSLEDRGVVLAHMPR